MAGPPRPVLDSNPDRDGRGTVPVIATATLLAVTVVLAAAVGGFALDRVPENEPAAVALSLSVEGDRIALLHRGGPSLDVRELRIRVSVDGTRLSSQPPVPFFSAAGFAPGPSGPFNSASDPEWTAGETASFRIAGTNRPVPDAGATIEVSVYENGRPIATLEATA